MGYAIEWAPEAEEDLDRLPPLLASHILDQIDMLAESPTRLSRPTHFSFVPGQYYRFDHEYEGKRYDLSVFFRYDQERALYIERIVCLPGFPKKT